LLFEINEYTSIEALNDIAFDSPELYAFTRGDYDVQDVINFTNEFGYEEFVKDLVLDEELDDLVQYNLEQRGWQGVKR